MNFRDRMPTYMPRDVNVARIGSKGRRKPRYHHRVFTKFYVVGIKRPPKDFDGLNIGYVVHAHCWALLNQVSGTTWTQTRLRKFVQAARKHWRAHELWEEATLTKHDSLSNSSISDKDEFEGDVYRSPLVVPEIRDAIERAKRTQHNAGSSHLTHIPLEIRMMVAELLCPVDYTRRDVRHTRNMLFAFGWTLPHSFWGKRIDEWLVFELPSLEGIGSVGWQCLCLDLMSLLCDKERYVSSGLATRERVLGLIEKILERF